MGQERRGVAGGALAGITIAALAAAGGAAWLFSGRGGEREAAINTAPRGQKPAATAKAPEATAEPGSESEALAKGSSEVLERVIARLAEEVADGRRAVPRALQLSAEEYVATLEPLIAGFSKYSENERRQILTLAKQSLERFSSEKAPDDWFRVLPPAETLFNLGMADTSPKVRVDALAHAGLYGRWYPDRSLAPVEEEYLTGFKVRLSRAFAARLADQNPVVRIAAVAALGAQPTRDEAAPGATLLADPITAVRCQVLLSYAKRPDVLDDEKILPLLMDSKPEVIDLAEKALKARGLTQEQIGMGRLAYHPKPDMRASAIDLLEMKGESLGLDREVWLIHLSRDVAPAVRLKAIEALGKEDPISIAVRNRLEEIVLLDTSPEVREAAKALVKPAEDVTASLPPLPGTPGLAPTAN